MQIILEVQDQNNSIKEKKLAIDKKVTVTGFLLMIGAMKDVCIKDQTSALVSMRNRRIVSNSMSLEELWNQVRDEDGWLYLRLQPSSPF